MRLAEIQPDCILVEGPAEATDLIHWLGHDDMSAPVALLLYRPDQPNQGSFFPYAEFSPEYQALRYGLANGCTVRFFDLPQANMMAAGTRPKMPDKHVFDAMTQAAGHQSYDQWWHNLIEQRQDNTAVFDGIFELMDTMRSQAEADRPDSPPEEVQKAMRLADQREAYMRTAIRQAQAEGHQSIAIICGAWHVPALTDLTYAEEDAELLKGMPRVEIEVAWVPWTYGRLANKSGYGAGIYSPGWYHHLWQCSENNLSSAEVSARWLTKVADLLRQEDLDASPAHVIEAVRLAEALAAMRNLPFPGLNELNEASQTILCEGDHSPMSLIKEKLVVSERMGTIPPDTPMVPLQRDIYMQQQKLRLQPDPAMKTYQLDLRESIDLERSLLLHRLNLLNIGWGKLLPSRNKLPGTYSESWRLMWEPKFSMRVIEAAMWGNTVRTAASNFAQDKADKAQDLATLTHLLDQTILADLPDTVLYLMNRIEEKTAVSSDIPLMMDALIPLARVFRYGSVRQLDEKVIRQVVDGLVTRICIGLPSTCQSLDDDAADDMLDKLVAVHATINTLQNVSHKESWEQALRKIADQPKVHGAIAGKVCRLLLDSRAFTIDDAALRMERALSLKTAVRASNEQLAQIAAWIDGFLQGSGLLVFHDQLLWALLDKFVSRIDSDRFQTILPLLRRTFSTFSDSARDQINRRIRQGKTAVSDTDLQPTIGFDEAQADAILPTLARLLGVSGVE